MTHRILDKLIIVIMTIAITFLLTENVTAIHVCLVLVSIILLAMDEMFGKRVMPIVTAVAVGIGAAIVPEVAVLIPVAVYGLISNHHDEGAGVSDMSAGNAGAGKSETLSSRRVVEYCLSVVLVAVAVVVAESVYGTVLLLMGVIFSAYLAYSTSHYENVIGRSAMLFDRAREEALENAKKRRELRDKTDAEIYTVRLKERNRIAREIHDNVGHMLTRAVVQLQAVLVMNKDEQIQPYLESVNETVNEAMTNIRKSVHELHDDSIDLSIGINELAATLKERFEVEVTTAIDSPVSNEMKLQILGIIKECVTNIAKHSNGTRVKIEVVENVTFWRMLIFDNGKSEPMELTGNSDFIARDSGKGIGLGNMKSRAETMGGRMTVKGGNDGFTVIVTIPKEQK